MYFSVAPCGNPILLISNETKTLTSPRFPNTYPPGLRCRWSLSDADSGNWETFTIHFANLDLEDSENCASERLSIANKNVIISLPIVTPH